MKYHYEPGAIRWMRHDCKGDVRLHRAPKDWEATAVQLDEHPTTGKPFKTMQWWIREEYQPD